MHRNFLVLTALCAALVPPAGAALQFVDVTTQVGTSNTLMAVTYDGTNTFVAVGTNSTVVKGTFVGPDVQYSKTSVPFAASLKSVAFGGGLFVAGSTNAIVFKSADGGGTWVRTTNAFRNQAIVQALAYDPALDTFVAAASIVNIAWANASSILDDAASTTNIWHDAGLPGASFLESYRSATLISGPNLAVCGIRGGIRTSSNGGTSWIVSRQLNINEPDLLGIASDGASGLVAAGTGGSIYYSSDAGGNWITNVASPTNVTLNAVAFNGAEFIAVGNSGTILTSADGTSWASQTPTAANHLPTAFSTNSLFGVASALAGRFQGLSILVGANGAVLLAGEPPAAPISDGDRSRCQGSPLATSTLSVSNAPDAIHPAGTVVVDWFATSTGGSPLPLGHATNQFTPLNDAPLNANTASNYHYFAQARDLRSGFVSSERTEVILTINPRPTATTSVSGQNAICNGDQTTVQVVLTGIGPWNFTWLSNGVPVLTKTAWASPADTLDVVPANPNLNAFIDAVYSVTNVSDANCTALSGDLTNNSIIRINPRPTAATSVTGQNPICNGDQTTVRVALTGLGPWNFTWLSNGISVLTKTGWPNPTDTLTVLPANPDLNAFTNTVYSVTNVSDAHCAAGSGDLTNNSVITINPRPTATTSVIGQSPICNGDTTIIQVVLTGLGPWNFTWRSNGIPVLTTNGAPNPTNTLAVYPANPHLKALTNTIYSVTGVSDANCTALSSDLTNNSVITINPRPTATTSVSGQSPICNGDPTTVQVVLTGLGPWNFTWLSNGIPVLTTNGAPNPTNTLTVDPANPLPNAFTAMIYSVTNLSDANCTALSSDLTNNSVITINPRPTATTSILGPNPICNGDTNTVQVVLTGLGPWNFTWLSNGIPVLTKVNWSNPTNTLAVRPANPHLNALTNTVYSVANVSDTHCAALAGDLANNSVITIYPRPGVTLLSSNAAFCDGGSYDLQFRLTGLATSTNFTVVWSDNYTQPNLSIGTNSRTLTLTNGSPSTAATNSYSVTNAFDSSSCASLRSDFLGTNTIIVFPVPGATLILRSNDFHSSVSGGIKATNVAGTNIFLHVTFSNGTNQIRITNHVNLTGAHPWRVTWMQVGYSSDSVPANTNVVITTNNSSPASFTWTVTIRNTTPGTNLTYSLADVSSISPNGVCSAALDGGNIYNVAFNATASADASVVGATSLCNGSATNVQIRVDLGGNPPWKIWWSDSAQPMTNILSTPHLTNISLTNLSQVMATNFIFSITNVGDRYSTNSQTTNDSDFASITLDPAPAAPPQNLGNATSCFDVAVPLLVSVPDGFTADWYSDPAGANLLLSGSTNFTPPVPILISGTNTSVTNVYWVAARYDDAALTNSCRSGLTNVSLISLRCTNQLSITQSKTNVIIQFYGNYQLQKATNLPPPDSWVTVAPGLIGTNRWTNLISLPPTNNFFRLYAPTN